MITVAASLVVCHPRYQLGRATKGLLAMYNAREPRFTICTTGCENLTGKGIRARVGYIEDGFDYDTYIDIILHTSST